MISWLFDGCTSAEQTLLNTHSLLNCVGAHMYVFVCICVCEKKKDTYIIFSNVNLYEFYVHVTVHRNKFL